MMCGYNANSIVAHGYDRQHSPEVAIFDTGYFNSLKTRVAL